MTVMMYRRSMPVATSGDADFNDQLNDYQNQKKDEATNAWDTINKELGSTPSDATGSDATPSDTTPSDAENNHATPSDATPTDASASDNAKLITEASKTDVATGSDTDAKK